jgi:hypothetical protein
MNLQANNPKAILLGAFDRVNYGDLLFPLVVGNEFARSSPATRHEVYALVESDLSRFGALQTKPIRSIYHAGSLCQGDVVLFAGGGTIGVDWTYMYANLLGKMGNTALYYLKSILGGGVADALSRTRFGDSCAVSLDCRTGRFPRSGQSRLQRSRRIGIRKAAGTDAGPNAQPLG